MGVNKLDRRAVSAANFLKPDGTSAIPSAATASVAGTVKRGVAVVNATDAATVITQLNALLASLRTAGVIAP